MRIYSILALQAGLAAALAWWVAGTVLGNEEPTFAPITAVGTVAASVGERVHRSIRLLAGVAIGIAAGNTLLALIGTGPWQTGLIVTLAVIVAVAMSGRGVLLTQAGGTAVLIGTVSPSAPDIEFSQLINATIGGLVGLVVVLLLLPLNPLRILNRTIAPVFEELIAQLEAIARALPNRDQQVARQALDRLRSISGELGRFSEALTGASEVVTLAPARWHRRHALARYREAGEQLLRALGNSRGLARRAVSAIEDNEPIPDSLPAAVACLAGAVRALHTELGNGRDFDSTRRHALQAVENAARAATEGTQLSGTVVVAQVRTAASDLLRGTGLDRTQANQIVRQTAKAAQAGKTT
ncbi:FUSC family protein [Micromonospora sp. NPDC000018]|uniref:FUSC family protein n=1 Tax=Micromonospora sp. NPDC000018 TaxID=3154239 RepID=UPI0033266A75